MKKEEKKKGLFASLFGAGKEKNGCCNIELEDISEEQENTEKNDKKEKNRKS